MNTFARSIPRTLRSLTQRRSFQVHDSRYMRRAKNLLLGSRTSSTFAAYTLWLAVKIMTSNISHTFSRNSWRKGLFRTYTVSFLSVIIWNVKSASHFSKEECIKVSASSQTKCNRVSIFQENCSSFILQIWKLLHSLLVFLLVHFIMVYNLIKY